MRQARKRSAFATLMLLRFEKPNRERLPFVASLARRNRPAALARRPGLPFKEKRREGLEDPCAKKDALQERLRPSYFKVNITFW